MRGQITWALACALALAVPVAAQVPGYPDVAYYKFNEGAGTAITNSAIPGGSLWLPQFEAGTGGVWDTTTPRVGPAALDFAGMDRLISNYSFDFMQSFTIECWIRVNVTTTTAPTCGANTGGNWCRLDRLWGDYTSGQGLSRCYIGFYNDGANFLGGGLPSLNNTINPAVNPVTDGLWHHIAIVFDSAAQTYTSYVDGNQDQQMPATGGNASGTGNFFLGGNQGVGAPFDGAVDEFRIWNSARTQAEIMTNMAVELSPGTNQTAAFSADPVSGPNPLLVTFTDLSTASCPGGITSWNWDFGDGNSSLLQNPCHVYTQSGPFDVSLTVTTACGSDTLTAAGLINVGAPAFVMATCGQGDLYVAAPSPPTGWFEGYSLVSLDTTDPLVGAGWFFGLYPDAATWLSFSYVAGPGNPFHFLNTGNPALFPDAPLNFPPGSLMLPVGTTMDAAVIYLDGLGTLLDWTNVSRVTF